MKLEKLEFTSQETKLYRTLKQGSSSKELICEALWADYALPQIKENRMHVLLKRLKGKLERYDLSIICKNGIYSLTPFMKK